MNTNPILKVLRLLTAFVGLLISTYAVIFIVLQLLGYADPFYAPNKMVAITYSLIVPLLAAVLAWYFTFKKPLSGTILALILLVSPIYLYASFTNWVNNKNINVYNDFSTTSNNAAISTDAQLNALRSRVTELSREVPLLKSQLNSLDFTYDKSSIDSYIDSTEISVGGRETSLPTLNFFPAGSHGGEGYLKVVDFSEVGDVALFAPNLVMESVAPSEDPSDLRSVTVGGKKYSFSSYVYGEGAPTDDKCFAGGGITKDLFTINDKNLAFIVTRTYSEKGCEGTPTQTTHTPSPEKVEEVLKLIESVKF